MCPGWRWRSEKTNWFEVELYAQLGEYTKAIKLATPIIAKKSATFSQRLTHAWLLAQTGRITEARTKVAEVRQAAKDNLVKAQAEHLFGNLTAMGADRDLRASVKHQTTANSLARPYLKDRDRLARRSARRLIIDVQLALARNVAAGPFKDRKKVALEWWQAGINAANEQPLTRKDIALQYEITRQLLVANAELSEPVSANIYAERLQSLFKSQLAGCSDKQFTARLQYQHAESLYNLARISRKQGQFDAALRYAVAARKLFYQNQNTDTDSMAFYLQGCTNFLIGSMYAAFEEDHAKACGYYDSALKQLRGAVPVIRGHEMGIHGERFVSMGVSYWEHERRDDAVSLTKEGAALMERAVSKKLITRSALVVPYGNLAEMNKTLGKDSESEDYARKAEAAGTKPTKRR